VTNANEETQGAAGTDEFEQLEGYALRRFHESGDVEWLIAHEEMIATAERRRKWREAKRAWRARQ
jgi:hypothetical protein